MLIRGGHFGIQFDLSVALINTIFLLIGLMILTDRSAATLHLSEFLLFYATFRIQSAIFFLPYRLVYVQSLWSLQTFDFQVIGISCSKIDLFMFCSAAYTFP